MKLGLNFEAKLDTVIRALHSGNFLASQASVDSLKTIDANATEAERDALAASLTYGNIGGGNSLTSSENVEVFIDNDNSDPASPYINWFRITRGQQAVPVNDPARELFTVAFQSTVSTRLSECIIGPRATTLTGAGEYPALLSIGSLHTGASGQQMFTIWPRGSINGTAIISLHKTDFIVNSGSMSTWAADKVIFKHTSGAVRGGWYDLSSRARFFIGTDPTGGGESLIFERTINSPDLAWRFITSNTTTEQNLFLSGSYPNPASDARLRVCVGGVPGAGNLSPDNILLDGTAYDAQFMVVTPQLNADRMGLWVYHRAATVPFNTHLNNLHSALDLQTASDTIRLFSVSGGWGGAHKTAFSVRADTSCDSPGGFFTAPADLAEYFETDVEYEPGTVIVMDPATGSFAVSSSTSSVNVIGVVSTKPGFGLNKQRDDKTYTPIAMSGTVPIKVKTSGGSIDVMDLLVSDEDGHACKAPSSPLPGSVIGKAFEALPQSGDTEVTGVIKMLIWRC